MEVHRPKLFHGWRELPKEVGIIVVGVLIALGAQEAVGWLHQRVEVREARQALRSEIARNAAAALYATEEQRCLNATQDRAVSASPNNHAQSSTGLPAGGLGFSTNTWDAVRAGAVTYLPLEERLAYSRFYSQVELDQSVFNQGLALNLRLYGYTAMAVLTPAEVRLSQQDLKRARLVGSIRSQFAVATIQAAKALGVDPEPYSTETREMLARSCV
jgi:hypothetical protein